MDRVRVSIRDTVGAALRFSAENWRFALIAAALGGAAHLVFSLVLGPLLLIGMIATSVLTHAALVAAALYGANAVRPRLGRDALRVAGSMGIVSFFVGILALVIVYVAMSVLIAPYVEQAKAAGENEAAMRAVMETAISAQPNVVMWGLAIGSVLIFLVTSRLYPAAPASVDSGRIIVFEAFRWTRGNALRIAGARLLVLLPALILTGALQMLLAMALGLGSDPMAIAMQGATQGSMTAVFYAAAFFLQIALYAPLEAGLATAIYRAVKPPPAA